MVTLCAKVVKVRQAVQANGKELVHRDFAVLVLIKLLQDGIHDVIGLLLVLDLVLCQQDNTSVGE